MKRGIAGLLVAEALSTIGSRMSMLAIPWLVLVTTQDPVKVGVVAFAEMIGASAGGLAIAALGPVGALWFDAASFAVCVGLVVSVVPKVRIPIPEHEPYVAALRTGFIGFRKDRLLRHVTGMLFVTNMFSQAGTVIFVPMWVFVVLGSPAALGVVSVAWALGGIIGSFLFAAVAPRLKRYPSIVFGFIAGGAPTFLVMALSENLLVVAAIMFLGGIAMCSVNPAIHAMVYERVPPAMLARVGGIVAAIILAGLPLGGLLGGWLVQRFGLVNGILASSVLYFATTLAPVIGHHLWRQIDDTARPLHLSPCRCSAACSGSGSRSRTTVGSGSCRCATAAGSFPSPRASLRRSPWMRSGI